MTPLESTTATPMEPYEWDTREAPGASPVPLEEVLDSSGYPMLVLARRDADTVSGNPWHDREGRFADAPPGIEIVTGRELLTRSTPATKRAIDATLKATGARKMALMAEGEEIVVRYLSATGGVAEDRFPMRHSGVNALETEQALEQASGVGVSSTIPPAGGKLPRSPAAPPAPESKPVPEPLPLLTISPVAPFDVPRRLDDGKLEELLPHLRGSQLDEVARKLSGFGNKDRTSRVVEAVRNDARASMADAARLPEALEHVRAAEPTRKVWGNDEVYKLLRGLESGSSIELSGLRVRKIGGYVYEVDGRYRDLAKERTMFAEFAVSVTDAANSHESKGVLDVPARITQAWIEATIPKLTEEQYQELLRVMRTRNWTEKDLEARVYPHWGTKELGDGLDPGDTVAWRDHRGDWRTGVVISRDGFGLEVEGDDPDEINGRFVKRYHQVSPARDPELPIGEFDGAQMQKAVKRWAMQLEGTPEHGTPGWNQASERKFEHETMSLLQSILHSMGAPESRLTSVGINEHMAKYDNASATMGWHGKMTLSGDHLMPRLMRLARETREGHLPSREALQGLRTLVHESLHSAQSGDTDRRAHDYGQEAGRFLEEALTETQARFAVANFVKVFDDPDWNVSEHQKNVLAGELLAYGSYTQEVNALWKMWLQPTLGREHSNYSGLRDADVEHGSRMMGAIYREAYSTGTMSDVGWRLVSLGAMLKQRTGKSMSVSYVPAAGRSPAAYIKKHIDEWIAQGRVPTPEGGLEEMWDDEFDEELVGRFLANVDFAEPDVDETALEGEQERRGTIAAEGSLTTATIVRIADNTVDVSAIDPITSTQLERDYGASIEDLAALFDSPKLGADGVKVTVHTVDRFAKGMQLSATLSVGGVDIGEMTRSVGLGGTAIHSSFMLHDKWQGRGYGRDLTESHMRVWKAMGLKEIRLTANDDVGGYAWARYGWSTLSDEKLEDFRQQLRSRLDEAHAAGKITDELHQHGQELLSAATGMWDIAGFRLGPVSGKDLLVGAIWAGSFDLTDGSPNMEQWQLYRATRDADEQ